MKTTPRGQSRTLFNLAAFASAVLALTGCGRAPDTAPAAPPVPAPQAVDLGDPVSNAILGSTERTLRARYANASVVLAEQALSTTASDRTICGRYVLLTRDTRRDRFFIAKVADLTELKSKADPRWVDACGTTKPLPGAVSAAEAEAQIASLSRH